MSGYTRWQDIRAEHVERAGGEEAVRAGKDEMQALTPSLDDDTGRPASDRAATLSPAT